MGLVQIDAVRLQGPQGGRRRERVQYSEGRRFIRSPSEDIASKSQWSDLQPGISQFAFLHGIVSLRSPICTVVMNLLLPRRRTFSGTSGSGGRSCRYRSIPPGPHPRERNQPPPPRPARPRKDPPSGEYPRARRSEVSPPAEEPESFPE